MSHSNSLVLIQRFETLTKEKTKELATLGPGGGGVKGSRKKTSFCNGSVIGHS